MTFAEAAKHLEALAPKIKTDFIDVAKLGDKKLEEELIKH